ncbi:MAG: cytochrome c [Gammaproteobacteria bacterium]
MNHLRRTMIGLLLCLGAGLAQASDVERGRILHQENCLHCHASMYGGDGTTIYVREDRRIESLSALEHQVQRCQDSLGLPWPEDQIADLIAYLNATFYHFPHE